MSTFDISLPDDMRAWIDEQVAKGGYGSASEYLIELIRRDWHRKAEEELEAKLLEGLNAEGEEWNDELKQAIMSEALQRINAKKVA